MLSIQIMCKYDIKVKTYHLGVQNRLMTRGGIREGMERWCGDTLSYNMYLYGIILCDIVLCTMNIYNDFFKDCHGNKDQEWMKKGNTDPLMAPFSQKAEYCHVLNHCGQ